MAEAVRLGRLGFLNTLPVYEGLRLLGERDERFGFTLVDGGPSPVALNALMEAGQLEIAPISSVELARRPGALGFVPGMSVSSAGPVGSVILFSRVPAGELKGRTVALPGNSATSVTLLRLLLRLHWRVEPRLVPAAGGTAEEMLRQADAALLIGDAALAARVARPDLHQADLAEAWNALTGLPMVFAVWGYRREWAAARPRALRWAVARLQEAQARGLAALPGLVPAWAERAGLPAAVLSDYYARCLEYGLGPRELRGLETFLALAREHALVGAERRAASGG